MTLFMAKSIPVIPKKRGRGRPATGKDPMVTARMPKRLIKSVDSWAAKHADGSRSEAIRRLVELSLTKQDPHAPGSALIPLGRRR